MSENETETMAQVILDLERETFPISGRFSCGGTTSRFEGWDHLATLLVEAVGSPPPPAEGLTPAQRRVAELALEGLTNQEIAERLVVSPRTVKRHLNDVFKRVGVRSRVELLRRAIEPGSDMGLAAHRSGAAPVESSTPGQAR